jgi:alpha-galactosidase/6-phospho-beta-glucosidase family protein
VDPAESIGYLFHSQGAGAKGQDRTQLAKFNREYAAAVAAYKKGSAGGVTPKVTNNHAADAAATESHVNQLGAFLQSQMDEKMRKEREERENWAQIENERIERGRREEAEAHDQEREKARRIAQELLAGWEKQQADRSKIKQSARVMGESWPFAPEHFKPTTPLRL